jgi:hypothetical protein
MNAHEAPRRMSRFSTRMAWDGTGNGHWDVVLTQSVNGRSVLLATIPLDEWISLGATQYVLELRRGPKPSDTSKRESCRSAPAAAIQRQQPPLAQVQEPGLYAGVMPDRLSTRSRVSQNRAAL